MKTFKGLSFLLQHPGLIGAPLQTLLDIANKVQGNYAINSNGGRITMVQDLDDIQLVFKTAREHFTRKGALGDMQQFVGDGIFSADGEDWVKQRAILQPAFHQRAISDGLRFTNEAFDQLVDRWSAATKTNPLHDLQVCTLQQTLRMQITPALEIDADQVIHWADEMAQQTSAFGSAMRQLKIQLLKMTGLKSNQTKELASISALKKVVDQLYLQGVSDSTQSGVLITAMLASGATPDQIKAEIATLIIAGIDTVAVALYWCIYELCRNPLWADKMRAEASDVDLQDLASIGQLSSTRAFIDEVLRLYPPVTILTRAVAVDSDPQYGKKGDYVFVCPFVVHRMQTYWQDPLTFRPERFQGMDAKTKAMQYFPFGIGKTTCIGNHLALTQITIGLQKLLAHYDFKLVDEKFQPSFLAQTILAVKQGFEVTIQKRKNTVQ